MSYRSSRSHKPQEEVMLATNRLLRILNCQAVGLCCRSSVAPRVL